MGLGKASVRLMLQEHAVRPFSGTVLQLGRQTVPATREEVEKWAGLHHVSLRAPLERVTRKPLDSGVKNGMDDGAFFSMFGFDNVESMDFSDFEKSTYVHDMNKPVPQSMHGKFDFIYDGGTLEHIFHLPQALTNIFHMLKPGGRIMHVSPSSNYVDHGFYSFSPTLFYDFYKANGYDVLSAFFYSHTTDREGPVTVYAYEPFVLNRVSFGGLKGDRLYMTSFLSQKTAASTCDQIPQQNFYSKMWSSEPAAAKRSFSVPEKILRELKRIPRTMTKPFRRPNAMPPIFAKW